MESAPPTVSVLVPCYNKRAYVEETLESVFVQTLPDVELIVVDDGSTDGSAELLTRLAKQRERCSVILGPNRGASAARQLALGHARGRFIQYLDADDVLLPTALAERVAALEASGADVAYSSYQRLARNESGTFEPRLTVYPSLEAVDENPEIACLTRFWVPPVALTYRRTLVDKLPPWNERLPVIQDARYLQEAAFAGARFVRVAAVLALYREDAENSLSQRSRRAFARDIVQNATEVEALFRSRGPLADAYRNALAQCYENAARIALAVDEEAFETCLSRLSALGRRRWLGWPSVADLLRRVVGPRRTAGLLARLGRPAL